jgi:hypothetical protein
MDMSDSDVSSYELGIKIKKNLFDNTVTLYSLQAFTDHLNELTLDGLYYSFNKILGKQSHVNFNLQEANVDFYTSTFYFSNNKMEHTTIDRETLINKRIEMCNFLKGAEFAHIPEDFNLIKKSTNENLNILMNKLCVLTSIIYIADISNLENNSNELTGRIHGYKTVMMSIDFKQNIFKLPLIFFDIYQWIYNSGNFSDKIGLSKNIITLQLQNDNILLISDNTLNSIKSSHELYLKQNIEQYIEVKNKLTEFLNEISNKTGAIIEEFSKSFKGNSIAFLTFFISVVVWNVVSSGGMKNVFTPQISQLLYILLFMSSLHLVFSRWEFKKNIKIHIRNFYLLKSN